MLADPKESNAWRQWLGFLVGLGIGRGVHASGGRAGLDITGSQAARKVFGRGCLAWLALVVGPGDWIGTCCCVLGKSWAKINLGQTCECRVYSK